MFKKKKKYEDDFEYENEEYEGEAYEEDYEDDYDDESENAKSTHLFMVILSVLLLAVTILCIVLTFSLRSSKKQVASLKDQVETLTSEQNATLWSYSTTPTTTVSTESTAPVDNNIPAGVSTEPVVTEPPVATPEPTVAPTPEPAPKEPELTSTVPSWVDESAINSQVRVPKEWYAAPGKLYVTADIAIRMRFGPSTDYGIVGTVARGAEVNVYAESGDWRFIKDERGNFGWASIKLMSTSPAA